MRLFLFSLLLLSLFGHSVTAQQQVPAAVVATRYQVSGADCASFPAVAELPPYVNEFFMIDKRFMPTRKEILTAEKALTRLDLYKVKPGTVRSYYAEYPALIKKQLPLYQRQYFGFYDRQGHRCLYINFFIMHTQEPPDSVPFWLREIVKVSDGGSAFWSIIYDVTARTFHHFSHNVEG